MNAIETIEKDGFTGKISQDECPESSRDWGNLGTMACFHSRYNLGDEPYNSNKDDVIFELFVACLGDVSKANSIVEKYESEYNSEDNRYRSKSDYCNERMFETIEKQYIYLPLYLYDHSGISINTSGFSCGWDSGQVGWIYVSKTEVKKEYKWKNLTKKRIEQIEGILKSEVETYDQYLKGEVYYITIENKEGEVIDSRGGYYGYDYALEELNSMLNAEIKFHEQQEFTLFINRSAEIPAIKS